MAALYSKRLRRSLGYGTAQSNFITAAYLSIGTALRNTDAAKFQDGNVDVLSETERNIIKTCRPIQQIES